MDLNKFLQKYQKKEVTIYRNQVAENPIVSICIQTYNHEDYIKECLDGILNQNVNFKYEILLGEDASSDGTRAICEEYAKQYPDIIKLFLHHRENNIKINGSPTGRFNYFYNMLSANGKYLAVCEGDDYWVDNNKLQKQVDYLESNEDCVISWTNYKSINEEGFIDTDFQFKNDLIKLDYNNIFSPYCTLTLTSVFKRSALDFEYLYALEYFKDNSLYVLLLKNGYGVFMNFVSAVYRVHDGGVYSLKSSFFKNYSSYLNLKEITNIIPESQTDNIKGVMKSLGNAAAFEVLKLKYSDEELNEKYLGFMKAYFNEADFKTKLKYYKRVFKHKFLK